ncbi:Tricarboxylate transport protein, mitochondrial [Liparis tanakae]|uniref:Tricarboxylate transport protein, mitochondrial n=2 Tax=Liparidae TaxID=183715 RepID=A0A4Z2DZ60_9TELE|nr:Tricarboxylate transport protein, mitochondrial [Liparis tanakae]
MNPLLTGAFGAVAGAASVFGNTPLDVIKTRMQGLEAHKYKSTMDCASKILRHEGVAA